MKVLLISPIGQNKFLGGEFYFRLPFLSLPVLAAWTPPEFDVSIIDEKVQEIDFDQNADLVGITVMTSLAPRAYEIADRFRNRGIKVVLGGMHPSAMPQEALQHADAIAVGEGEKIWPILLEDFKHNRLQRIYQNKQLVELKQLPRPRRDLLKKDEYLPVNFVETSRGCPYNCQFCSVTRFFGGKFRNRPVDEVASELSGLEHTTKRFALKRVVFFTDDNIIGNPEYIKQLLPIVKEHQLQWLGQAPIGLAKHEDLMCLMADSGCMGLEIGFETFFPDDDTNKIGKPIKREEEYLEAVEIIHDHGIGIQGSFIFGFDHDTPDSFERCARFVEKARLDSLYMGILTPYPGTMLYKQFQEEGRLLHQDWEFYDTAHVVYKPKGMTQQQLQDGFFWFLKEIYSYRSMWKRLWSHTPRFSFFGPMNFGFRQSFKRLHKNFNHEGTFDLSQ